MDTTWGLFLTYPPLMSPEENAIPNLGEEMGYAEKATEIFVG